MKKILILTSNEVLGTINNDKKYLSQDAHLPDLWINYPEQCSGPCGMVQTISETNGDQFHCVIYDNNGISIILGQIFDNDEWNQESIEVWPDAFTLLIKKDVADKFVPMVTKYGTIEVTTLFSDKTLGRPDTEEELSSGGSCNLR